MHAETPGFIRRGANDRAIAQPSDDNGLAAQLRVVALFHGSVEGVHVDMDGLSQSNNRKMPFLV